jgi:hypothetical protein
MEKGIAQSLTLSMSLLVFTLSSLSEQSFCSLPDSNFLTISLSLLNWLSELALNYSFHIYLLFNHMHLLGPAIILTRKVSSITYSWLLYNIFHDNRLSVMDRTTMRNAILWWCMCGLVTQVLLVRQKKLYLTVNWLLLQYCLIEVLQ